MSLTDGQFMDAMKTFKAFAERLGRSDELAQVGTMDVAAALDAVFHDGRWVKARNEQRAATAKTARGGRPVEPESRSQFSTWLLDQVDGFAPRVTYQLLDAHSISSSFLSGAQKTPNAEWQVRPLKPLLSVANGKGERIPAVWELACKLAADAGRDQPTAADVKKGLAEWRRIHLPPAQAKRERSEDQGWVLERKAEAAWRELVRRGRQDQIEKFLTKIREDVDKIRETGERPT